MTHTTRVGWMYHNKRGRRYHKLFVPTGHRKALPELKFDALHWDAPEVDDVVLHLRAQTGVNLIPELSQSESKFPCQLEYDSLKSPKTWAERTDQSRESALAYRLNRDWERALIEQDCRESAERAQKSKRARDEIRYNEITEEQKAAQRVRNELMRLEEQLAPPAPDLGSYCIRFVGGFLNGRTLPCRADVIDKRPTVIGVNLAGGVRFAYEFLGGRRDEKLTTVKYKPLSDSWVAEHRKWAAALSETLPNPWSALTSAATLIDCNLIDFIDGN